MNRGLSALFLVGLLCSIASKRLRLLGAAPERRKRRCMEREIGALSAPLCQVNFLEEEFKEAEEPLLHQQTAAAGDC